MTEKLCQNLKIWGFRTITSSKVYIWFNWNFGILLHIKCERTLLIFGHFRSRSQWPENSAKIWKYEVFRTITSKVFIWFNWKVWYIVAYHVRENSIDFQDISYVNIHNSLLIDHFVVFCPVENISLILRRHHCRWRAANLDLCLALMAFSSEGSLACHTCCDTGPPFLRSYPKDPWFSLLNAELLAKEQSLPIFTS